MFFFKRQKGINTLKNQIKLSQRKLAQGVPKKA